ncbi:barstar family protein [Xenorhabdus bovienii]|uniref:barstar family protein n=1 Tax=Xenorhabdus bovienii TaxID=40576 RepID=UPI0023B2203F|nr:barstar family protein [Xenorhabdus bovienii]MDE9551649.1 barstar family protein [Xenorhabdus bovienii]
MILRPYFLLGKKYGNTWVLGVYFNITVTKLNRGDGEMQELYYIYNSQGDMLFSCKNLIECHDFSRTDSALLFAFSGLNVKNVDFILDDEDYTLKCNQFQGRLDFDFSVKKVIKSDDILYLYLEKNNPMYEIGVLSLLKSRFDDNERIWLDMALESKQIYISASYIVGGMRGGIEKDTVVVEGKYIHDYYSFYCEFGYAFFGKFGYMGSNLDAFEDCLVEIGREDKTINVIWKDSEVSFKAIANTTPDRLYKTIYHDMVMTLEEHCNLILE